MSILARDERAIIAENIRYHAAHGVDCFIVMDNGSVDGTRELLEELRNEVELEVLEEPSHTHDQDRWVTRMAKRLRKRGVADWVINNDADEFWVSASGNLRADLEAETRPAGLLDRVRGRRATIVRCPRFNMLPRAGDVDRPGYRFYDNVLKVARPLGLQPEASDPEQELVYPMMLRTMPGKVACALKGLERVFPGNHFVRHATPRVCDSRRIQVFHYPLQTFDEFERRVKNLGESLRRNTRLPPSVGWHRRRWYALYESGRLREEYDQLVLSDERARELIHAGVVVEEPLLRDHFRSQDGYGQAPAVSP